MTQHVQPTHTAHCDMLHHSMLKISRSGS